MKNLLISEAHGVHAHLKWNIHRNYTFQRTPVTVHGKYPDFQLKFPIQIPNKVRKNLELDPIFQLGPISSCAVSCRHIRVTL